MKKVLLIDDDTNLTEVFKTALTAAGLEISVANNGTSGLETAKASPFDLILLDQVMPDMKGNEVLVQLKSQEATKDIPVVMLTNFAHDDMITQALNAGAEEYILKYQVSTDDLVSKVKSLVGEQ